MRLLTLILCLFVFSCDDNDNPVIPDSEDDGYSSQETNTPERYCPDENACNTGGSLPCQYCHQNDCDTYPDEVYDCDGECLDSLNCP